MTMKKYGNAANYPIDLNDGRTLAPGQIVELDFDEYPNEHDQARINHGTLLEVNENGPVLVDETPPPEEEKGTDNRQHRGRKGGSA